VVTKAGIPDLVIALPLDVIDVEAKTGTAEHEVATAGRPQTLATSPQQPPMWRRPGAWDAPAFNVSQIAGEIVPQHPRCQSRLCGHQVAIAWPAAG
jgi:hypothetical protein